MLFDVHSHLDFPQFDPDREKVIERAREKNIFIICSGLGPASIEKTLELAGKHPNVYATLGLSPTEFDEEVLDETFSLIKKNRHAIIGVGEVGLDYYWVKGEDERVAEAENFHRFIKLSKKLRLPLVVHSRDAESQVLSILEETDTPALMHCFSGSLEQAEKAVSMGCLISIPTSIAYSKSKKKLAQNLPLESLVLETDSPYLAPEPKTRNEPANILLSCEMVAGLQGVEPSIVEEKTSGNAIKFFDLKGI